VRHDDDRCIIVGEAIIGNVSVGFKETSIVEDNAFGDEIFISGDLGFGDDSMPTLPSGNWVSNVNKFGLGISPSCILEFDPHITGFGVTSKGNAFCSKIFTD
jgi:hypothetical protein